MTIKLVIEPKGHDHKQKNMILNNCDGLNCFNRSSNKIEVSAGTYGRINLSLCDSCACLFKEKEKNGVQNTTNAV